MLVVVVLKELLLAWREVVQGFLFQGPCPLTALREGTSSRLHQGPAHELPHSFRFSSPSNITISTPGPLLHRAQILTQPLARLQLHRRHQGG